MSTTDARRRRQLEQLRELCRRGALERAIDLAFEHVATFGRDDEIVVLLEGSCATRSVPSAVRQRLRDLGADQY